MEGELSIPPEALSAPAREMIRVWLANQKLQTVLNIGFWQDRGLNERECWGILLANMVRHIADAHEAAYGHSPNETIAIICRAFAAEMKNATSPRTGAFVRAKPRGAT